VDCTCTPASSLQSRGLARASPASITCMRVAAQDVTSEAKSWRLKVGRLCGAMSIVPPAALRRVGPSALHRTPVATVTNSSENKRLVAFEKKKLIDCICATRTPVERSARLQRRVSRPGRQRRQQSARAGTKRKRARGGRAGECQWAGRRVADAGRLEMWQNQSWDE
jgi:hypothetical protein